MLDFAAYLERIGLSASEQPTLQAILHRTSDSHVFASRAAVRQIQLVGHGVV